MSSAPARGKPNPSSARRLKRGLGTSPALGASSGGAGVSQGTTSAQTAPYDGLEVYAVLDLSAR